MPDANPNEDLRDAFVRHQIGLLRHAAHLSEGAIETIDIGEDRLRELIRRYMQLLGGERVDFTSEAVKDRLARMREEIREIRESAVRSAREDLEEQSRQLAVAQWAWLGASATAIAGDRISTPGRITARTMVRDVPFEGRTLRTWFDDLAALDTRRIYDEITTGLVQQRSMTQVQRAIIGTRMMDGTDGLTQHTRNDIASIVQTGVIHFSAQANAAAARQNRDVFGREVYTAVLDGRTTAICRSLDGNVYAIGKGPIPPLHYNCRSIRVSTFSRYPRPQSISYRDWVRRQPAAFREEVLVSAREDRFVDNLGRSYTLKELAQMDARALRQAGLDPGNYGR